MTMSLETDAAPAGAEAPRCGPLLEAATLVELPPEALDAILGPALPLDPPGKTPARNDA